MSLPKLSHPFLVFEKLLYILLNLFFPDCAWNVSCWTLSNHNNQSINYILTEYKYLSNKILLNFKTATMCVKWTGSTQITRSLLRFSDCEMFVILFCLVIVFILLVVIYVERFFVKPIPRCISMRGHSVLIFISHALSKCNQTDCNPSVSNYIVHIFLLENYGYFK